MFNKDVIEAMINAKVKEMMKNLKITFNFFYEFQFMSENVGCVLYHTKQFNVERVVMG